MQSSKRLLKGCARLLVLHLDLRLRALCQGQLDEEGYAQIVADLPQPQDEIVRNEAAQPNRSLASEQHRTLYHRLSILSPESQ